MSFTPRTVSPEGSYSPFYMKQGTYTGALNTAILGNTLQGEGIGLTGANVLNNCVGYSQGRMAEMYCEENGIISPVNPFASFSMDAQDWLSAALDAGYETGLTPRLAAVGVYQSRSDPSLGHVCNIEQYANGRWEISEGHYFHPNPPGYGSWDYSYLNNTNLKPAFIENSNDWYLLGFIYPFTVTPPGPSGPPADGYKMKKTLLYLKRRPF